MAQASHQWGLCTPDKLFVGSVVAAGAVTLIAQVGGEQALTAGDVVAAAGLADPLPGSGDSLALVRPAAAASLAGIVGVVERRMALVAKPKQSGDSSQALVLELRSAQGPAQPGDYVAIVVLGAARVKVTVADGAVAVGQRLTAAGAGRARPLGAIKVQRAGDGGAADMVESAPVLGTALEPLTSTEGFIWVLVNPQ